MSGRTQVISVHRLRRVARRRERELQALLDGHRRLAETVPSMQWKSEGDYYYGLPGWAQGVRVERAGLFQHAVVATERRGH